MSRIGKEPVPIPSGVTVLVEGSTVTVKGPKGELSRTFSSEMKIRKEDDSVIVERPSDSRTHKSLHGLTRALIANMVTGVTTGFQKELEIIGVGYRAQKKGKDLEVAVGYSQPVVYKVRQGVDVEVPTPTKIVVSGTSKELVGQVAAEIRAIRRPEPYKGKGIRYVGEYVRRKVGKAAK